MYFNGLYLPLSNRFRLASTTPDVIGVVLYGDAHAFKDALSVSEVNGHRTWILNCSRM